MRESLNWYRLTYGQQIWLDYWRVREGKVGFDKGVRCGIEYIKEVKMVRVSICELEDGIKVNVVLPQWLVIKIEADLTIEDIGDYLEEVRDD